jgi:uncharacterized protein YdiU (UPF0061 family)
MTIFYRLLAQVGTEADPQKAIDETLMEAYYRPQQLNNEYRARMEGWLRTYQARVLQDGISNEARRQRMDAVNPKYVMRNYLAQLAIDRQKLAITRWSTSYWRLCAAHTMNNPARRNTR